MRDLMEVGRAEATDVALVVAPAGRLVGLRHLDRLLDELADERLVVRLAPALAEVGGSGAMASRRASCSSNSRMTRARAARCQASIGLAAGWFCVSRAMAARGMATPLTLTWRGFWLIVGLMEQPVSRGLLSP